MTKAIKATSRVAIGKKLRFSVFERDDFTCQYCGKNPKDHDIILNLDHAVSVKDGGDNSEDNLITSCWDCNIGKGATSVVRKEGKRDVEDELRKADERLSQIKAMIKSKSRLKEAEVEIERLEYDFVSCFDIFSNDDGYNTTSSAILSLLKKRRKGGVSLEILCDSVEVTFNKFGEEDEIRTTDVVKYLSAVIRTKSLEKEDPVGAEIKRQQVGAYYKACNEFNYVNRTMFFFFIEELGVPTLESFISSSRNWSEFRELCEDALNPSE